jgi:hypothetical protein
MESLPSPSFHILAGRRGPLLVTMAALTLLAPQPASGQGMGLNSYRQGIHDKEIGAFSGDKPGHFGWAWGELYYDGTYHSDLLVTNDCETPRPVEAWVGSGISPYLSIAEVTIVPPKTVDFKVPATITTPPEPQIIVPPGGYSFDATPWVDIGARPLNRIVLKHKADEKCRSKDKIYDVSGHIHVDPDPPDPDQDTDACTAIWNSGNPLPGYDLEQCAERFRELLRHYRNSMLKPFMEENPDAWAWFPSDETIEAMSAEELLDAKKEAALQRAEAAAAEALSG